ncbi:MAG: cation transporter [Thermoleophilaceae bacterium]|nr:cation transporter [Thermoleophilaceae bacterium]
MADNAPHAKSSAAAVSIFSNTALIGMKVVAGALTGSIAILTEAVHSGIDLVASTVAYVSVRKSEQPPDVDHPYGHEKMESLAAVIEGMLILVGAGIILFESTRRLISDPSVERLGVGMAVMAVSMFVNIGVSSFLYRRARETKSEALAADAAHLRIDAATSATVFLGFGLMKITGWYRTDAIVAMIVSVAIVAAGLRILTASSRVLVDESIPDEELARVRKAIEQNNAPELIGYHRLRARGGEGRRHIDLHVQFHDNVTLERAHAIAHELEDAICAELGEADVLIHLEPDSSADLGEK